MLANPFPEEAIFGHEGWFRTPWDPLGWRQAPHVALSHRTPPGPEGSKGKWALAGAWGALVFPGVRTGAAGRESVRETTCRWGPISS
ncbi:hypothetical protein GCM10010359_33490 [Streptomyces morookaense]|nr:hypothetical protein GCM10010359_33490 [Streptomyces morookaense]